MELLLKLCNYKVPINQAVLTVITTINFYRYLPFKNKERLSYLREVSIYHRIVKRKKSLLLTISISLSQLCRKALDKY